MSWTDHFPVLADEAVDVYHALASPVEKGEIDSHFAIRQVINPQPAGHVVSCSLFWKPASADERAFPPLSREVLIHPERFGIASRVNDPWQHYVEPLLEGARILRERRADVTFRVYLADDLDFLAADLTNAGCEVVVMESRSVLHNPGAMWRFLAMEGPEIVTVTDADHAREVVHDVARTEAAIAAGLGSWRAPYTWGPARLHANIAAHYRPMIACQFGSSLGFPMRDLMAAFIWCVRTGRIPKLAPEAFGEPEAYLGSEWPAYGFDEWFLMCAIFPRMAPGGVATFIRPSDFTLHHLFALDIEYVTWANPASEILYLPWEPPSPEETDQQS